MYNETGGLVDTTVSGNMNIDRSQDIIETLSLEK